MDRKGSDSEESTRKRSRSRERSRSKRRSRSPQEGSSQTSRQEDGKERGAGSYQSKKRKFRDSEKGRKYECALCDCIFYTVSQYNLHIQSFEHRKRVIAKRSDSTLHGATGTLKSSVHCAICNIFLNSKKQQSEHLNGTRHKQLCFKLNVPLSSLTISKDHTETLEDTRLHGNKLMCKFCSVELNSMQQYEKHVKSKNHLLRKDHKTVNHVKAVIRATKALMIKNKKKHKEEVAKRDKRDKSHGEQECGTLTDESTKDTGTKHELPIKIPKKEDDASASKVLKKYGFGELGDLDYGGCPLLTKVVRKAPKVKRPPKPMPYMCDICQVFVNSAFHLNEHLLTAGHREKMQQLISGGKRSTEPAEDKEEDAEDKKKKPELYCDVCQCMAASKPMFDLHLNGKKHKFLAELKQGKPAESQKPSSRQKPQRAGLEADPRKDMKLYCEICQEAQASQRAFDEHLTSKKHKFLSQLKPPNQKLEAQAHRGQPVAHGSKKPDDKGQPSGSRRSEDRRRRRSGSGDREDRPKKRLSAYEELVLERQKIQKELEKREKEIEEQKKLVEKLEAEKHEESEKSVLRKMIAECRKLLEERQRKTAEMRAREESWKRDLSPSSSRSGDMWNRSPPADRHQYDGNGPRTGPEALGDRFQARFSHGSPGGHDPLRDAKEAGMRLHGCRDDEARRYTDGAFAQSHHSTNVPPNWSESAKGQHLRHHPEHQSDRIESWHALTKLEKPASATRPASHEGGMDAAQVSYAQKIEERIAHSPAQWPVSHKVSTQGQPQRERGRSQQEIRGYCSSFQAAEQLGESSRTSYGADEDGQQLGGTSFPPWCTSQKPKEFPEWQAKPNVDSNSRSSEPMGDRWQQCSSAAPFSLQQEKENLEHRSSAWQSCESQWAPVANAAVALQPTMQLQPSKSLQESKEQWKQRSNLVHIQTVDVKPPVLHQQSALRQVPILDHIPAQALDHMAKSSSQRQSSEQQIQTVSSQHGLLSLNRVDDREACDSNFPTDRPPAPKKKPLLPLPHLKKEGHAMKEAVPGSLSFLDSAKEEEQPPLNLGLPGKPDCRAGERQQAWDVGSPRAEGSTLGKPRQQLVEPRREYPTSMDPWCLSNPPFLSGDREPGDGFMARPFAGAASEGYPRFSQNTGHGNDRSSWNPSFSDDHSFQNQSFGDDRSTRDMGHSNDRSSRNLGFSDDRGFRNIGYSDNRTPLQDSGPSQAYEGSPRTSYQEARVASKMGTASTDSSWDRRRHGGDSMHDILYEPEDGPRWAASESSRPAYAHGGGKEWMGWGMSSDKEKGATRADTGEQSPDRGNAFTFSWGGGSKEDTVRIPGLDFV